MGVKNIVQIFLWKGIAMPMNECLEIEGTTNVLWRCHCGTLEEITKAAIPLKKNCRGCSNSINRKKQKAKTLKARLEREAE